MRILFTIPHYYRHGSKAEDGKGHGSARNDPKRRTVALSSCLTALHQLYNDSQLSLNHAKKRTIPFDRHVGCQIDVVLCTTGDSHLLAQLSLASQLFENWATNATPTLLGYECHAVLRDRLGGYDYYGYLEDDLILHDPWFFIKLEWFTNWMGDSSLLQPNRFEASVRDSAQRIYIDGDLAARCTAPFQNLSDSKVVTAEVLGKAVTFRRTLNPHAGCFFLNARQMEHWTRQPYFLERDTRFVGPLESAASLGIMRAFEIYKPALEAVGFLDIEHFGSAYLDMMRVSGVARPEVLRRAWQCLQAVHALRSTSGRATRPECIGCEGGLIAQSSGPGSTSFPAERATICGLPKMTRLPGADPKGKSISEPIIPP